MRSSNIRRLVVIALAALACGCQSTKPVQEEPIPAALAETSEVWVVFCDVTVDVDKDDGSKTIEVQPHTGTATPAGEKEWLITPHELPPALRVPGARGFVQIEGKIMSYTVKEIEATENVVEGWATIETEHASSASLTVPTTDYVRPLPPGTRLYGVGYPTNCENAVDFDSSPEIIGSENVEGLASLLVPKIRRKVFPMTVIADVPSESTEGGVFLTAKPDREEDLQGASGGGVYLLDAEQRLVRVGIHAGQTRGGGEPASLLIVRPR